MTHITPSFDGVRSLTPSKLQSNRNTGSGNPTFLRHYFEESPQNLRKYERRGTEKVPEILVVNQSIVQDRITEE